MKVINLFGAPSCGKSTLRAEIFSFLKRRSYSIEEVHEYAKDMVWEDRNNILTDQIYMLAKQNRRVSRLEGKVDWVITDSPILLGVFYQPEKDAYKETLTQLIVEVFKGYDNINIFLHRDHPYEENGRYQNEEEAMKISNEILNFLKNNDIPFIEINTSELTMDIVITLINENS